MDAADPAGPRHLRPGHPMGRFYARPCGDNVYECPIYTADGPTALRYFAHSQAEAFLLAMWLHPDCAAYLPGTQWPPAPRCQEEFLARARDALARIRAVLAAYGPTVADAWTQTPPATSASTSTSTSPRAALPDPTETPSKPPVTARIVEMLHDEAGVPSTPWMFKKLKEEGYRNFNNLTALSRAIAPYRAACWEKAPRANLTGRIDQVLNEVQATRPEGHTKKQWRAIIQKRLGVDDRAVRNYFSNRTAHGHIRSSPDSDRVVLARRSFKFGKPRKPAAPAPGQRVTRSSTRRAEQLSNQAPTP